MDKTFKHEVKFISLILGEEQVFVETTLTKEATFKEFSRTDRSQRELAWMVMEIFQQEKEKTILNREIASKIADKFVEEMLIIADDFTEENRKELFSDNGAMIKLGLWLAHEKVLPFFLKLMEE